MYIQDVYKKYLENVWKNKIISEISKILLTVGTLLLGAFPWPKGSLVGIFQKILNYTCKLLCQDLGSHGGVIWGRNSLLGIENSLLVSSRHWKGVRDVSQCRFFCVEWSPSGPVWLLWHDFHLLVLPGLTQWTLLFSYFSTSK